MAKGRTLKYPELQRKFQQVLLEKVPVDPPRSNGSEILRILNENAKAYNISDEELDDLNNNWSNYTYRAKENGILQSYGKHKGYSILGQPVSMDSNVESGNASDQSLILFESFLHIPVTFLLSYEFNGRAISMTSMTDKLKWANPDMLLIRDSANYSVLGESVGALIEMVDSSPHYILSSIEIKYNIGNNRGNILNILSQAVINGLWANENWLIFFNDKSSPTDFDDDALAFASANGLGIKQLIIEDDDDNKPYLEFKNLLNPQIRNNLRLNSSFSDEGQRKNLMQEIASIIRNYKEEGSYLEKDHNYAKLADLLLNSYNNIKKQKGYSSKGDIEKRIETLLSKLKWMKDFLNALPRLFSTVIEIQEEENMRNKIESDVRLQSKAFSITDNEEILEFYDLLVSRSS